MEEQRFWSAYETFARRLVLEWNTEREASPHSTDGGKLILQKAYDQLLNFASDPVVSSHPGLSEIFSSLLIELRSLQQHQLFIDGGESWREFWDKGSTVVQRIESVPKEIRQ